MVLGPPVWPAGASTATTTAPKKAGSGTPTVGVGSALSWCCRALVALCGAILFAIGCESWAAGTHKRASSSRNLIAHDWASRDGDSDSGGRGLCSSAARSPRLACDHYFEWRAIFSSF